MAPTWAVPGLLLFALMLIGNSPFKLCYIVQLNNHLNVFMCGIHTHELSKTLQQCADKRTDAKPSRERMPEPRNQSKLGHFNFKNQKQQRRTWNQEKFSVKGLERSSRI